MLVVVCIAGLLISLTANMAGDVILANQITMAGETVVDELRQARHAAQVKNRVVEVRFYKPSKPDAFGEPMGVSAIQTFIFDQDNRISQPMREWKRLPEAVKITEEVTLSPLMTQARLKNDWKEGDAKISLPEIGKEYDAYRVRFLPDGTTDLNTQQQWFFTLQSRNAKGVPPANYVTVQIKPTRGNIRTYRPN